MKMTRWPLERYFYYGLVISAWIFMFVPVVFVIWVSFFESEIISFPPSGYSVKWFVNAWSEAQFFSGFITSIQVSLIAMIGGLVLGVPASIAIVRGRFPGRSALNSFLLSPLIIPGIVAGSAIYIFFVQIEMWTGVRVITTIPGFVVAHVALTVPWTVRLVCASLGSLNRSVEEAAASLGASPFVVFRRVTLPMIKPALVAACIFSFIVSFTDLEMSLYLVGPGRSTLQIAMLQYLEWKFDPTIAAVSVVQIVIIGLALVTANKFVKLSSVV